MKYCSKCHNKCEDDALFCSNCRHPFAFNPSEDDVSVQEYKSNQSPNPKKSKKPYFIGCAVVILMIVGGYLFLSKDKLSYDYYVNKAHQEVLPSDSIAYYAKALKINYDLQLINEIDKLLQNEPNAIDLITNIQSALREKDFNVLAIRIHLRDAEKKFLAKDYEKVWYNLSEARRYGFKEDKFKYFEELVAIKKGEDVDVEKAIEAKQKPSPTYKYYNHTTNVYSSETKNNSTYYDDGDDFIYNEGDTIYDEGDGDDYIYNEGDEYNDNSEGDDYIYNEGDEINDNSQGDDYIYNEGDEINDNSEGDDYIYNEGDEVNDNSEGDDYIYDEGDESFEVAPLPGDENYDETSDEVYDEDLSYDEYIEDEVAVDSSDEIIVDDSENVVANDFEDDAIDNSDEITTDDSEDETILVDISSEFYIYDSDCRYLTEDELSVYSSEELGYIRNEIFARHGYVFESSEYSEYFNSTSWYVEDSSYSGDDSTLNEYELANINLIKSLE